MMPPISSNDSMISVHVPLPDRAYDILIGRGASDHAGTRIAALAKNGRVALVTDRHVADLHADKVEASLIQAGLSPTRIIVPAGERSKSSATLIEVCEAILAARIERGDIVLALGGGVIGDLSGFAASIVRRGVRVVQMPTTLLAQVDSSVGGKTGINSPHGKNLIGTFHQPSLVIADTALLDTLPLREFRAGYAEVAKYGLLGDAKLFAWCEANWQDILSGGPARDLAVAASCRAKASIVVRDEREDGERALLNLGHTFAHALERFVDYNGERLVHGEAVAIGLVLAAHFSVKLGLCAGQDASRIAGHLAQVGLPTRISDIPGPRPSTAELVDAMKQDKKVSRGNLTFILMRAIGEAFIKRDVDINEVTAFLDEALQER
jgi:3-dehydroquinate synthase